MLFGNTRGKWKQSGVSGGALYGRESGYNIRANVSSVSALSSQSGRAPRGQKFAVSRSLKLNHAAHGAASERIGRSQPFRLQKSKIGNHLENSGPRSIRGLGVQSEYWNSTVAVQSRGHWYELSGALRIRAQGYVRRPSIDAQRGDQFSKRNYSRYWAVSASRPAQPSRYWPRNSGRRRPQPAFRKADADPGTNSFVRFV